MHTKIDILFDRHMVPERVALKHQTDTAFLGRDINALCDGINHLIADDNLPAAGVLNSGYHAQNGGFAAA